MFSVVFAGDREACDVRVLAVLPAEQFVRRAAVPDAHAVRRLHEGPVTQG